MAVEQLFAYCVNSQANVQFFQNTTNKNSQYQKHKLTSGKILPDGPWFLNVELTLV